MHVIKGVIVLKRLQGDE